jgi:hypothetical protein
MKRCVHKKTRRDIDILGIEKGVLESENDNYFGKTGED